MPHTEHKGTLTKLSDNKNALRTDSVTGTFNFLPELHSGFLIFSEALDKTKGDMRAVTTSPITQMVQDGNVYTFQTLNSTYQLILDEDQNKP